MIPQEIHDAKILIVDDTPENLDILFNCLTNCGFKTLIAQSGEDALELVKINPPDLILLDVLMPGMDGFETCIQLKKMESFVEIPVLFLSALSETTDKIRAFSVGGVDFISKPFQQEEIIARITTHLSLYRLRKDLKETNIRLQKEIQERRLAEKNAISANRAKSDFLAHMSHELRTPLNGILGYAQILKRDRYLDETQRKAVDIIERSGIHLLNLINDILDMSKIEARKMELHLMEFDLAAMVSGIVPMIQVQADKKKIAFNITVDIPCPCIVKGDEKKLGQILLNLLSNAIKYTSIGSVYFTVELVQKKSNDPNQDNLTIRFKVQDTGCGIPERKFKNIFQPFSRVGDHFRSIEGTGLGLSITKKLIQLMGGDLHFDSKEGKGSEFWFDIEFQEADTIPASKIYPHVVGYTVDQPDTDSCQKKSVYSILVVDDKWENRTVLAGMLAPLGFEIIEASDGREGLEKAKKHRPDLIFMDLVMPILDGFEASRKIRQIPELNHTKIIAISASTLVSKDQIVNEAGCDDFIRKPAQFHEILDVVGTHLNLKWICEAPKNQGQSGKCTIKEPESVCHIQFPEQPLLDGLIELALDGNFLEMNRQMDHMERNPIYQNFVHKLRHLINEMDEDAILNFLQPK